MTCFAGLDVRLQKNQQLRSKMGRRARRKEIGNRRKLPHQVSNPDFLAEELGLRQQAVGSKDT
jgi:hypothetical protein